mmetsp:Transcript_31086/g.89141  ORF Transcript_31086/g.89141 Transcript_31086/m.89141 type:complete len:755 (-) Transcript_31086:41-2305(-)
MVPDDANHEHRVHQKPVLCVPELGHEERAAQIRFPDLSKDHKVPVNYPRDEEVDEGENRYQGAQCAEHYRDDEVDGPLGGARADAVVVLVLRLRQHHRPLRAHHGPPDKVLDELYVSCQVQRVDDPLHEHVVQIEVREVRKRVCQESQNAEGALHRILYPANECAAQRGNQHNENQVEPEEPSLELQLGPGVRSEDEEGAEDQHQDRWQEAREGGERERSHHPLEDHARLGRQHLDAEVPLEGLEAGQRADPADQGQEAEEDARHAGVAHKVRELHLVLLHLQILVDGVLMLGRHMGDPVLSAGRAPHAQHQPRLSLGGEGHEARVRVHRLCPLRELPHKVARGVLLLDHGLCRGIQHPLPFRISLRLQSVELLLVVLDLVVLSNESAAYPHEPVGIECWPPAWVLVVLLELKHGLLQPEPRPLAPPRQLGEPARLLDQVDRLDAAGEEHLEVGLQLRVRTPVLRDALHQHGGGARRFQLQEPAHADLQEPVHCLIHLVLCDKHHVPDHDDMDPENRAALFHVRHANLAQAVHLAAPGKEVDRAEDAHQGHAYEEEQPHAEVRKLDQHHLVHPDAGPHLVHGHLEGGGGPAEVALVREEGRRVEAALVEGPCIVLIELRVHVAEADKGYEADQQGNGVGSEGEPQHCKVPRFVHFKGQGLLPAMCLFAGCGILILAGCGILLRLVRRPEVLQPVAQLISQGARALWLGPRDVGRGVGVDPGHPDLTLEEALGLIEVAFEATGLRRSEGCSNEGG